MIKAYWFTGLSGSGKTTLAYALHKRITNSLVLDGDEIRAGICSDLGFSDQDRYENIRRIAFIAKAAIKSGITPIVATISPLEVHRVLARKIVPVIEIYCAAPLEVCIQRDVKGHYAKAKAGLIQGFTGISAKYEPPQDGIHLDTTTSIEDCLSKIL